MWSWGQGGVTQPCTEVGGDRKGPPLEPWGGTALR